VVASKSLMVRLAVTLTVVALGASACLGGSASPGTAPTGAATGGTTPTAQPGALTIRVNVNPCTPTMWGPCVSMSRHYSLTCAPAGGTMPNPQAACAAVADYESYVEHGGTLYTCKLVGRTTASAVIAGTYAGKHFSLRLDNTSWCGVSMRVMRDYWALSAFPCSVVVVHTQSVQPYSKFAADSGCDQALPSPAQFPTLPDASLRTKRWPSFERNGLAFRYPATWRRYTWQFASSFSYAVVYLSTAIEHDPCKTIVSAKGTTITCGSPLSHLDRSGLLVTWFDHGFPTTTFTDFPGAHTRIDGHPARIDIGTATAQCSRLGGQRSITAYIGTSASASDWTELDACLRGPNLVTNQRRVEDLLTTTHFTA
jgi:hypothetical protein